MPTLDDFLVRVAALAPFAGSLPFLSLLLDPDDPVVAWAKENGRTVHSSASGGIYDVDYAGVQIRITTHRRVG